MPKEEKTPETAAVQQVDIDLDNWLGTPGGDNVVVPKDAEKTPSFFDNSKDELSFLDKDETAEDTEDTEEGKKQEDVKAVLNSLDDDIKPETEEDEPVVEEKKAGRPKTEKSALVNFLKKRIESGDMFTFDDYDEEKQSIDDYLQGLSEKDVEELWNANISERDEKIAEKTPKEFFSSLPEELQLAAKYWMDGGTDMKSLFSALSQVEQTRALTVEHDAEEIAYSYLKAKNFGSEEEIRSEIDDWKEIGSLSKKAEQFKPKLDQMQEELVQARLADQERMRKQQEDAAKVYVESVFEALRPAELSGIKLDRKIQQDLYNGLTQPSYRSVSGNPTNLLGHLLEKYQFVEPNHGLVAEALWLLSDPEAYRSQIKQQGSTNEAEKIARKLKTEQSRKTSAPSAQEEERVKPNKLKRPANFFQR